MSDNISSKGLGKAMLAVGWLLIMVLLTLFFTGMEDKQENPKPLPRVIEPKWYKPSRFKTKPLPPLRCQWPNQWS